MNVTLSGLLLPLQPERVWREVHDRAAGVPMLLLAHTIPFALIPSLAWYYGVTVSGWTLAGETMRLTTDSALPLCALFFLAMVTGVLILGYLVAWMSPAYGGSGGLARGVALVTYTASPFFLIGLIGLFPVLWLDILVGIAIGTYCIYLLYRGTGVMMEVAEDRSFLYASSVLAVSLVGLVALMGVTIVLWDIGPAPEYTY